MRRASTVAALSVASLLAIFTLACGGGNPERESIGDRGGVAGATPDQRPATGTTTAGTTGVPGSSGPRTTLDQDPGSAESMTSSSIEDATEGSPRPDDDGNTSSTSTP